MRSLVILATFGVTSTLTHPAFAQDKPDCDAQVELVMGAVDARADGQSKRRTRNGLKKELGENAAEMLADWIYALDKSQLNEEVGAVWRAQCEAM